ncbi:hypothetical protein BGX27_003379 [Mortierella sp. AM989]|nr:hypothetical protein BGX27_003379 [Mortierella sp. AM989]
MNVVQPLVTAAPVADTTITPTATTVPLATTALLQAHEIDTSSVSTTNGGISATAVGNTQYQQQLQQYNKERMIANVIQQGKILKVSRRLRTRLEYAILKIRRGWSKYTLQEVESLLQPGNLSLSPPSQSRRSVKATPTIIAASPRQSERKRTRKVYADYETSARTQTPPEATVNSKSNSSEIMGGEESRYKRYRPSRPSFSQFKDSELFLPAKSLMNIATSAPSASPSPPLRQHHSYTHQSYSHHAYSQQQRQQQQEPQRQQQQREAQANFEFGPAEPLYHESAPSASSWSSYFTPPSPATESSAKMAMQGSHMDERKTQHERDDEAEGPPDTQAARTILLLASSPTRPPSRTLSNSSLGSNSQQDQIGEPPSNAAVAAIIATASSSAMPYSPVASSPLVQSQVLASTSSSSPTPSGSPVINDDNPFLVKKGTIKTTATAQKNRQDARQNEPTSMSHPPLSAAPPLISTPSDTTSGEIQEGGIRAVTPTVDETATLTLVTPQTPPSSQHKQNSPQEHQTALFGIRTPPPSGGKEPAPGHYASRGQSPRSIAAESIAARRRNSGLTGSPRVDLVTMYLKPDQSTSESSPSPSSILLNAEKQA